MKMPEIKEIAKRHSIKLSGMNKGDLIRSIQQSEGNTQCFASERQGECDQVSCLWREDCFEAMKA